MITIIMIRSESLRAWDFLFFFFFLLVGGVLGLATRRLRAWDLGGPLLAELSGSKVPMSLTAMNFLDAKKLRHPEVRFDCAGHTKGRFPTCPPGTP